MKKTIYVIYDLVIYTPAYYTYRLADKLFNLLSRFDVYIRHKGYR